MKHRYITNQKEIEDIINKCEACHVSMIAPDGSPYGITLNFGYQDGVIYLHSSKEGLKIDSLKQNPSVCIAFSTDYQLRYQSEQVACSYSMKYRSVLAFGKVEFEEELAEKERILKIIMSHYIDREFTFNEPALREVCVYRVKAEKFTARVYGY